MKVFLWIFGFIISLVIAIYIILFTAIGNSLLVPIVEEKINKEVNLHTKFTIFSISFDEFEIDLALDADNSIYAKGRYSILDKSFKLVYDIKLNKLENLNQVTKQKLQGSAFTNGSIKGDEVFIIIDGVSNIASSDTKYHLELKDFKPSAIIANVKNLDLHSLLKMSNNKPYADAKVDLDINFKNINPRAFDGDVVLITKNGKLNTKLINKELELNIPKTSFSMNVNAVLKDDNIKYKYALKSNLAKINSDGIVYPKPLKVNSNYIIDIKELALLQPIIKEKFRGPLKLKGTVKGNKKRMLVDAKTNFASSDTVLKLVLQDLKPLSLKSTMKHIGLKKALYMLNKPQYADGNLNVEVDIQNMKKGQLKGTINTNIQKGLINSKLMTKELKFASKMPKTTFTLATQTVLKGENVDTKLSIKSNLANLDMNRIRVNIIKNTIKSDYIVIVPELKKIYFAIERHIEGSFKAKGEFSKTKKDLDVILHSKIAGGDINLKLHNDDLHAELTSIRTKAAMSILKYPPIFASSLNGVLDYNSKKKIGKFSGKLLDGGFDNNIVFGLVQKYAKIDMYKQKFKGSISADINNEKVLASFDLHSNSSSIKTVNTKINSLTQTINSKIDIVANKHPVSVILSGNKSKPKVEVDVKKVVADQIKKQLGNFLKGLL